MTKTITSIKFVATTTQVQDVVIWMDDVEDAIKEQGIEETIQALLDRVLIGEWKNYGSIHVVDDNKEIAQAFADALNARYEKEMELMNEANVARKEVEAAAPKKDKTALRSNAEAKKFLKDQAAKLANAKQSKSKNKSEGEETMTTTNEATKIRRTKKAAPKTEEETTVNTTAKKETAKKETAVKEKSAAIKEKNVEKKEKAAGRRSSSVKEVATQTQEKAEAGKMGRDKPQGQTSFVKFEGPWYLNASRYEVLNRLPQIIEDRGDDALGIEAITFSAHTEIKKYQNKRDVVVVEQFKSNGAILDFPIKVNAAGDKVSSPSIGWVEYNGKRYPRFGFYRPNTLSVDFTCGCGTKNNTAGNENMYCSGCKKVWADLDVTVGEYGFDFDLTGSLDMHGNKKDGTPWMFQEIPNMKIEEEMLVLALALAHFDQGLDMWDLIDFEEDAE